MTSRAVLLLPVALIALLRGGSGQDFLADYDGGDLLLAGTGDDRAVLGC